MHSRNQALLFPLEPFFCDANFQLRTFLTRIFTFPIFPRAAMTKLFTKNHFVQLIVHLPMSKTGEKLAGLYYFKN